MRWLLKRYEKTLSSLSLVSSAMVCSLSFSYWQPAELNEQEQNVLIVVSRTVSTQGPIRSFVLAERSADISWKHLGGCEFSTRQLALDELCIGAMMLEQFVV